MKLDFEQIKQLIPQRFPIILIDKVVEFEAGKNITCIKNISGNDIFFLGHFPDQAIVPGVLIIEAMAQAALILAKLSKKPDEQNKNYVLASVKKTRFLHPVVPGDQMKIAVNVIKLVSTAGIVEAKVIVDDEVKAEGEISFAVS